MPEEYRTEPYVHAAAHTSRTEGGVAGRASPVLTSLVLSCPARQPSHGRPAHQTRAAATTASTRAHAHALAVLRLPHAGAVGRRLPFLVLNTFPPPPPFLSRPRELQYFVHAMHRVSCSAATLTKGKRRRTTWQACTHKAQGTKHSSRRPTRPPGPRQRSTAAAAHDAQSALRSCRPARAQRPAYARVTNQTARAEVEE